MRFVNRETQTVSVSWAVPVRFAFVMVLLLAFAGHASAQALQITTTTLPGGVNGASYPSQVLQASGGTPPYGSAPADCNDPAQSHWCVVSGSLPTGITLTTDGIVGGTPSASGTFNFVVRLRDSGVGAAKQTASRSLSIVISDPLAITTASLPNGTFGSAYPPQSLNASGGTPPHTWSVIGGALPQGLSLSSTGTISGTPTLAGTSTFTVRVVDSGSPAQSATRNLAITILPVITPTTVPNATVGVPYPTQTLAASPGVTAPLTWSLSSGALPPGITLSGSGVIDGTPTTSGTFNFTVGMSDSSTPQLTASRAYTIAVQPPLTITTTSLPAGTVGNPYPPQTLSTSGGTLPISWSVVAGALPQGLSLSSTGTISGTPTLSGRSTFTVRAVDSSSPPLSATATLSIAIQPVITTSSLPQAAVGVPYGPQTLTASPGNTPYTWALTAGALPDGLTLSAVGVIDGTPTTSGTSNFTVGLTDSSSPPLTASKPLSILVQPALAITTTSPLPTGVAGAFYAQQFTSVGPSPVTWSVASGTQPPGLQLSQTGALTGVPQVAGTYVFTVQASASNPTQTAQQTFVVTINSALNITTQVLPTAVAQASYSTTLTATGGIAPYNWTATAPPPQGLTLSGSGVLSGVPTTAGTFSFTAQVTDSNNPAQQDSQNLVLVVSSSLAVVTSTLPDGEAGKTYNFTLTAGAGTQPYSWSVQSGALPAGLNLATDGTLSGTLASNAAGTYNFTAQVSDNSSPTQTATKPLTLRIRGPLEITTPSLLPIGMFNPSAPVFYFKQLEITTEQTSLAWTVVSGALPPGITLSPTTGLLSGFPTTPGTFDFTVKVDGSNPVQTTQKAFRIIINPPLTIRTPPVLPDAFLGVGYSQALTADGGLAGYTWSNPGGGLPPGLTLSSAGIISGTPGGVGTYNFVIQVDDSFSPTQTARSTFSLRVNNSLRISTESLPNAIRNLAYSKQLEATGGTAPLNWVINSGTLPNGLTLTAAGLISGTPTNVEAKFVTITVTDSRGLSASKDFTITVDPSLPTLLAPGLPPSISPASASQIAFALASPFPSPLTGQLVLTFTSKAEVPGDDPMTRFSNGTRTVNFTVPANNTSAILETPVVLTAGTVAGTIRLAANFDNGPQDVTVATTEIPATAPRLTSVVAVRTGTGLEVQVTGYSPSRRIIGAEFTFDLNVGGTTSRVTVVANGAAANAFAAWFTSPTSVQFGSGFSYVQFFDYTGGNVNDVQSVTVRLTNAQGSTSSGAIPFK
jgi:hypothetical protein